MPDYKLSKFGIRVNDEPEDESEPDDDSEPEASSTRRYPNGRCPALAITHRGRCRAPVSRMNNADGFCGAHARERNPWTIHGDPEELILLTGRLDVATLGALDQEDVDFDVERIREAVEAVKRGEGA